MQKYTVDRETWGRGKTSTSHMLDIGTSGLMCCLGHIGKQCGYTDEQQRGGHYPHDVVVRFCSVNSLFPASLINTSNLFSDAVTSPLGYLMADKNDDIRLSDEEREAKLKELALIGGFELEFIN